MSYFSYTCRVHFDVLTLLLVPQLPHPDAGDEVEEYTDDDTFGPDYVYKAGATLDQSSYEDGAFSIGVLNKVIIIFFQTHGSFCNEV